MKKKVLITMVSLFILTVVGVCFSNANAHINPDCPNGCVRGNDKCLCGGWNYGVKEADWGSSTVKTHYSKKLFLI